ncbi:MAG: mechanosensitive ion channel [Bacteroidales bacterium]|jgi:small-conductance mechanosensitive channel|nr:mechanosensitive ion channel [Bacteroidales bacterium]MDD2571289.1 mechanosensitive ion channel [Bacteroidales bacterium]MDD2812288.1 mechanosensitive ion channel [Bacteroidales bacterium]MDD3385639.1 mechanosensitive ion channel [Bacteroidales bacterium]MDD3871092.1 mechanosensitive ion channel [Bacteroidales bacterium]
MKEFLDQTLINLGNYELKVHALLMLAIFLIAVVLVLFVIRHTVYRISKHEAGKKFAIYSLIKYIIVVIAFLISLQILGFKLTVLLAGSAALLVGIGLGLQNLFGDFVSGIILLADTAIKVNDVIEVNGLVCQVLHINLRTTTVITRDDKYSLVLKDPAPTVRFSNFGDSSLDFTLLFWADEIFRVEKTKSELRIKIYELFQQNNVTIPFPQRVIHSAHK